MAGCWAHGYAIHFHVMHETSKKDSAATIQMLAEMIEEVARLCSQRNRSMPTQLLIVAACLRLDGVQARGFRA